MVALDVQSFHTFTGMFFADVQNLTTSQVDRHNVADIHLDEVKMLLENKGFPRKPEGAKEDL